MRATSLNATATHGVRARFLLSTASAAILSIALAQPAFAQASQPAPSSVANGGENDQPAAAVGNESPTTPAPAAAQTASPGQEIVVTGSRIARRDYQANSPIVTAGQQLLQQSATSSIESNLNKLPQFTPANLHTPTTGGGDIQPTARNTPGSAQVSLRGIGANRTLVLVNGRRATPADATGTVDINTIPSAAVERVEIISGGASSTYGADAVAGVTNFILKSKFSGLELDAQSGITERGDNFEFQVSGIMGANFDDGRGNVSLAMSVNERHSALQANRPWYKRLWANPSIGGTGFFSARPGVNLGFGNNVNAATLASLFPGANPAVPGAGVVIYVNPNGTLFSGFDQAGRGGSSFAQNVDNYNLKRLNTGLLGQNDTYLYLVFPATRYNVFAQGNYELSEAVEFFGQANFSNSQTNSIQEPGPVVGGWNALIPYNPASPQANIPQALRTLLNARANPTAPFNIQFLLPFNRTSSGDVYSYNMTAGVRGHLPINDWSYEIFGQQGRTASNVTQGGFASLQRLRTVLAFGNFGQGFKATGNPEGGGFGASTATCTTGLNPFGGAVSNDCYEAIKADIKTKSTMNQTIWEGDLQGTLVKVPAGDLKFSVGASYRRNAYTFQNDTLTTQGRSFLEQSLGLYPAGNSSGTINVKEAYGELLVPVLHDLPFVQEFNLELGGRVSKYNTTGTSYTYKALADWKVTDWLRFRGGYNRAERAPNVAELFLAPEQSFVSAPGGDVCSRLNTLPYSANPATNPTNAAKVEALCRALMRRSGDPTAETQFYDNGAPQPVGASFVFPTLTGNANLTPEKADTYTAGVVISSPFEAEMLKRLRLTVDYYNIRVKNSIGAQSVDIAQRQCFDTAFNPTLDANNPNCAGINRNTVGTLGNVITTFVNNGRFRTSGVDVQADWAFSAGPGQINLNAVFNYLISMKAAELPVLPLVEYRGTLGPTNNGLNGGSYRWKLFTTLGYSIGGNSLSLQWRHLPAINVESKATVPTTTFVGYPSYDIFNLLGTIAATRDLVFRFGVENLLDKAPPLGNINTAASTALGQLPGGSFNAQFYDTIGRRYYVGAKAKF